MRGHNTAKMKKHGQKKYARKKKFSKSFFSKLNKLLLVLISSSSVLILYLSGCAHNRPPYSPSSRHSGGALDFSEEDNPDGDNDIKGSLYFPTNRPATGKTIFIFDPNAGAWALYDKDGKRLNTGRASGGSHYCPDVGRPCKTIVGKFKVYSKGDADCISSIYPLETNGGAPMPYCMRFHNGYAIHGSYDIPDYNASHGCIRITPRAAEWLSTNYMHIGTSVVVLPYK